MQESLTPSFSWRQQVAGFVHTSLEDALRTCMDWVWSLNYGSARDRRGLPGKEGASQTSTEGTNPQRVAIALPLPAAIQQLSQSPLLCSVAPAREPLQPNLVPSAFAQHTGPGGCQEGRQHRGQGYRPAVGKGDRTRDRDAYSQRQERGRTHL